MFGLALGQEILLHENRPKRPILSRNTRQVFAAELAALDKVLMEHMIVDLEDGTTGNFVRQEYIKSLNARLARRRMTARDSFLLAGEMIPALPSWGRNGNTFEVLDDNDFEIYGICYREDVEELIGYLYAYHTFCNPIDPYAELVPVRARIEKVEVENETLVEKPAVESVSNRDASTIFHPALSTITESPSSYSSSNRMQEMFSDSRRPSASLPPPPPPPPTNPQASAVHPIPPSGPPDDDPDDSDDNGRGPSRNPRQNLPAGRTPRPVNPPSFDRQPMGVHLDKKLKFDTIPEWNGDPNSLGRWMIKVNALSTISDSVYTDLGTLVPRRLTGSAETWYYSQSSDRRAEIESDWGTLKRAIGIYWMNRAWLDKQKLRAVRSTYQDSEASTESPSQYMIREIMEGAPTHWNNLLKRATAAHGKKRFQNAVKYHEDNLVALDLPKRRVADVPEYSRNRDSYPRNRYQNTRNARVNLVGASTNLPPPAYPKDDKNISPNGTPEAKGARPCRHCGSGKHWDYQCKYSRKGERQARVNFVTANDSDNEAQEEYDNLYYDLPDSEDEEHSTGPQPDFREPSQ
ncbi:hypothetical protein PLICRDRAFT_97177, partial [Plicaturopsis crispa FD-325 SS-3]